jgi:hypothetical protein
MGLGCRHHACYIPDRLLFAGRLSFQAGVSRSAELYSCGAQPPEAGFLATGSGSPYFSGGRGGGSAGLQACEHASYNRWALALAVVAGRLSCQAVRNFVPSQGEHVCLWFLLPSAFCLLPSAFCLLPSAFCLLPSAFCLLPTCNKNTRSAHPRANSALHRSNSPRINASRVRRAPQADGVLRRAFLDTRTEKSST